MELDFQRKDGSTLRQNLQQAERSTGKALIDEPEIPFCAAHVWEWFWQLSETRPEGFSGSGPLTYGEIDAWARRTGNAPTPWEVEALKAMDRAYLASVAKLSS